ERLDEGLGHIHGAGRPRAVRHQHDRPTSFRLLAHPLAAPRIKTVSPGTEKAPVHQDLPKGEPGQGVGSGSRVWTSKVRLDWKVVNTSEGEANDIRSGTYAGASRGLGKGVGGLWRCRVSGSSGSSIRRWERQ